MAPWIGVLMGVLFGTLALQLAQCQPTVSSAQDAERRRQAVEVELPAGLQPDAAFFDAAALGSVIDFSGGVQLWQDADVRRSSNLLVFNGSARLDQQPAGSSTSGPAIYFNGRTFAGLIAELPWSAWSSDPAAPFTAVWIGRLAEGVDSSAEQWLLGVGLGLGLGGSGDSGPPDGYSDGSDGGGMAMSTLRLVTRTAADGYGIRESSVDSALRPPMGQWSMEVLVRNAGAASASYLRCSQTSCLATAGAVAGAGTRQLASSPCRVGPEAFSVGGDFFYAAGTSPKYLTGHVAVVALYSRALSQVDVAQLAAVYRPRFGLSELPPPPPPSPAPPSPAPPSPAPPSPAPPDPKPPLPLPPFPQPPSPQPPSPQPPLPSPPSPQPPNPPLPSPQPPLPPLPSPTPPSPHPPSPEPPSPPPPSPPASSAVPPALSTPAPSPLGASPSPPSPVSSIPSPQPPSPTPPTPTPAMTPAVLPSVPSPPAPNAQAPSPAVAVHTAAPPASPLPPSPLHPAPSPEANAAMPPSPSPTAGGSAQEAPNQQLPAPAPPITQPAVAPSPGPAVGQSPSPSANSSAAQPAHSPSTAFPDLSPPPSAATASPTSGPSPGTITPAPAPSPSPTPSPSPSPSPSPAPSGSTSLLSSVPAELLSSDASSSSATLEASWDYVVPDPTATAAATGGTRSSFKTTSYSLAASDLTGRSSLLAEQFPGATGVRVRSVVLLVPALRLPASLACSTQLGFGLRSTLLAAVQQATGLAAGGSEGGAHGGVDVSVSCSSTGASAKLASASTASGLHHRRLLRLLAQAGTSGTSASTGCEAPAGGNTALAVTLRLLSGAAGSSSDLGGGGSVTGSDLSQLVHSTLLTWRDGGGSGNDGSSTPSALQQLCIPSPSSDSVRAEVRVTYAAYLSAQGRAVYSSACAGTASTTTSTSSLLPERAAALGLSGVTSCAVLDTDGNLVAGSAANGAPGQQVLGSTDSGAAAGSAAASQPVGGAASAQAGQGMTGGSSSQGSSQGSSNTGAIAGGVIGALLGLTVVVVVAVLVVLRKRKASEAAVTDLMMSHNPLAMSMATPAKDPVESPGVELPQTAHQYQHQLQAQEHQDQSQDPVDPPLKTMASAPTPSGASPPLSPSASIAAQVRKLLTVLHRSGSQLVEARSSQYRVHPQAAGAGAGLAAAPGSGALTMSTSLQGPLGSLRLDEAWSQAAFPPAPASPSQSGPSAGGSPPAGGAAAGLNSSLRRSRRVLSPDAAAVGEALMPPPPLAPYTSGEVGAASRRRPSRVCEEGDEGEQHEEQQQQEGELPQEEEMPHAGVRSVRVTAEEVARLDGLRAAAAGVWKGAAHDALLSPGLPNAGGPSDGGSTESGADEAASALPLDANAGGSAGYGVARTARRTDSINLMAMPPGGSSTPRF